MDLRTASATALAVAGAFAAIGAAPALAANHIKVGNNPSNCPSADFTTIQAAVDAASPGDDITVCPGTYQEQVNIPAGKDNIDLESQKPLQAVIQAPPALAAPKTIVRVNGAHGVSIEKFTIQGPGDGVCDSLEYGVRVDAGGSADIAFNHITHIRDTPFGGCQNGVAVQVGRASESSPGSATVRFNQIDDYQKNGLTVSGEGSNANVAFNVIKGAGPTSTTAQNGAQVSSGADANVTANAISDNVYSPGTVTATGVLVFGPVGDVNVSANVLKANDTGVYAFGTDRFTRVSTNKISSSTFDGITLDTVTQTLLQNNDSSNNDEGIGVYGSTGAKVDNNDTDDNDTDGLFADSGTSGNAFTNNEASGNGNLDCEDTSTGTGTAGTANTWLRDTGDTDSPNGICQPPRGHHSGHGHGHGQHHPHGFWGWK